jgi:hypothetical protein
MAGLTVTIDGSECTCKFVSPTIIDCITPPGQTEGTFDIVATLNGKTVAFSGFTYDSASTPVVSALSPTTAPTVLGGTILTIDGTAFGTTPGTVTLCTKQCTILTWIATQITCNLPQNKDGMCKAIITIPGNGFADVRSVPDITYTFKITGMEPMGGSVMGGTTVKLQGDGFSSNCDNLDIVLGEEMTCTILECTNTEIICTTMRVKRKIEVKNTASHPIHGYGYRWNPSVATAYPGDMISWRWTLGSAASADSGINIFEIVEIGMSTFFFKKLVRKCCSHAFMIH